MQLLDSLFRNAIIAKFLVYIVKTYLVELINSHGDIHNLLSLANYLSNTGKDLTVIDLDADTHTKLGKDCIYNLHQLNLVEKRIRTNHVGIALIELAIATLLWTVGTPYWLNLIALERHLQLITMLHHVACERHGKIVAKTLLAELCCQLE